MSKQSFVTGQVLTAQQVNDLQTNDFNQTVSAKTANYTLVAADKGTRITMSSTIATTITVNSSLFDAGDTLFIQNLNTGVSTITAGTATVSTASSLALAQHEGGTLYFTSAGVSTFYKAAGAAAGGGGKVLQVLQDTANTSVSNSTTTYAATGLSQAITCAAASSKVLVTVSLPISKSDENSTNAVGIEIKRDSTAIITTPNVLLYTETAVRLFSTWSYSFLDSPSSTASLTYTVNFRNRFSQAAVLVCYESSPASIILQEIGA